MIKVYKNISGKRLSGYFLGFGDVVVSKDAVSVELDTSVAESFNKRSSQPVLVEFRHVEVEPPVVENPVESVESPEHVTPPVEVVETSEDDFDLFDDDTTAEVSDVNDLSTLSLDELRALCDEQGLVYTAGATSKKLIKLLKA